MGTVWKLSQLYEDMEIDEELDSDVFGVVCRNGHSEEKED